MISAYGEGAESSTCDIHNLLTPGPLETDLYYIAYCTSDVLYIGSSEESCILSTFDTTAQFSNTFAELIVL